MKGWLLLGVGLLLVFAGVVWTFQGLGILGGSTMSGDPLWVVLGPLVAIGGGYAMLRGVRRFGRPSDTSAK